MLMFNEQGDICAHTNNCAIIAQWVACIRCDVDDTENTNNKVWIRWEEDGIEEMRRIVPSNDEYEFYVLLALHELVKEGLVPYIQQGDTLLACLRSIGYKGK